MPRTLENMIAVGVFAALLMGMLSLAHRIGFYLPLPPPGMGF